MNMDEAITRINELARKAKSVGLSENEIDERNELRRRYIDAFKASLKQQLDSIKYVEDEDK
ncbi:MAG: DUF896 domain-containing protein [Paenibacillaceae bacterium]|uniref:DUF896 domain-containing protein n=1 Tax=Paenibacillus cymbidii TaxID=1639034 RepID=UPI00108033E5|nr:DUF896 domain-containing protein [Paenibacillus cymbidii]MBO9610327.1 DUF896 domain-containing protein [Paenibacillaceae bacterium]